jgi:5-methyltetrahydropteroyltriglutamate--homocysteine methyltransferase
MSAGARAVMTTHTGSLPRPDRIRDALLDRQADRPGSAERVAEAAEAAVAEVVARQVRAGLGIVNDGEAAKVSYATYVRERLDGFAGEGTGRPMADLEEFPRYRQRLFAESPLRTARMALACTGVVRLADPGAVHADIARLLRALEGTGTPVQNAFMTAASPGVITRFFENKYYSSEEEYLWAVAEAMRPEYQAVVEAGVTLQVDCPDLASARNTVYAGQPLEAFRRAAAQQVEALNWALAGLSPERLRMHVCWGNYPGPHHLDVELGDIIDILLRAAPSGLSLEGANPRHGHDWVVFERVRLPDDKYLLPGVIDSTSNFIEHPDLVAERLDRYAGVVGRSRVVASTDCGFSTFAGAETVDPDIAWAKLGSLVEGARRSAAG